MRKDDIWRILKIDETKNQELIKEAYRKQLINTNPEDDAQGFMNLRNAYEEAVKLCSEADEEQISKNDIDLWIDQADVIYRDVYKRRNTKLWEEILESPVCKGVDTYIEAREALLSYLMNNYYLPQAVWVLLDSKFYFVRDKEVLLQTFPKDFIEYVIRQIENYSLMDFDLFTVSNGGDIDDYIRSYYNIKRMIDENKTEDLWQELHRIYETGIYHPYFDAERLRYYIGIDNKEEIEKLIKKLSAYLNDDYIAYYAAKGYQALERYEDAAHIWEKLCEKFPMHYGAGIGMLEYYIHKGQYKRANEHALDLLRKYVNDEAIYVLLVKANEYLIAEYEEECRKDPDNLEIKEELAWCYYLNARIDECILLLNEIPGGEKEKSWYLKICGYVYLKKGELPKALEHLFKWLDLIQASKEGESWKKDFCRCNQLIGISYIGEENYEQSIAYLKNSISIEENTGEKLSTMERLAYAFLKLGRNEDCIDVCDDIVRQSERSYPAYIHRQEAFFNMKNGKGVIDDYYKAVEAYAGFAKPYLIAAKVFYLYEQYEDSIGVVKRAKEAGVSSNELEFLYGKNLRLAAQNAEESKAALKVFSDLYKNMSEKSKAIDEDKEKNGKNEDEFNDLGDILNETAKVYADMGQFEKALDTIKEAIDINPKDDYYTTKAYLYMDLELYEHAIEILKKQVKVFPESEYIHVCLASCYYKKGRDEDALELYKKTLDINPDNVEALEKVGDSYINLYKCKGSIEYYETAIRYGERLLELKSDSYCYVHVGIMYEKGYEFEKSLNCYEKASELNPDDMWPHNNAGYVYKLMKRYEDAIREYKIAIELMEPGQAAQPHSNLGTCYEILERYEDALNCFREVLKYWPSNQNIHENMASVLVKMGRYDEAVEIHLNMKKKWGLKRSEANRSIMHIYEASGNLTKAKIYAWKVILSYENKNWRDLADFYFNIGKLQEAKDFYSMSINKESKEEPDYYVPFIGLTSVYFDKNKKKKAEEWAEKAMTAIKNAYGDENNFTAYKPNGALHHYRLGMLYLMLGEHDKAEAYFTKALEHLPCQNCRSFKCYEALYGFGRMYEDRKQFDMAEKYYTDALRYNSSALYRRRLKNVKKRQGKK